MSKSLVTQTPLGLAGKCSYPVSGQSLCSVLVYNPNVPGWLDPGFPIHLHRYALIPQDGDLHRATLNRCNAVIPGPGDLSTHRPCC